MANVLVHSIRQVQPIASPASIMIQFTVLGILPDKVQVYAGGVGGQLAELKDEVDIAPPEIDYASTFELASGTAYRIHLCPRTTTDGVPDDKIDDVFFETFCTRLDFTTQAPAAAAPTGPTAPRAPVIEAVTPRQATLHAPGRIDVAWNAPDRCDKYHFLWTDSFPAPATQVGWSETEIGAPQSRGGAFSIPNTSLGRAYTFKVQGCQAFDLGPDNCSPFSPQAAFQMPPNTRSLREFLRLSHVALQPGLRSLGAPAFAAGLRAMMRL